MYSHRTERKRISCEMQTIYLFVCVVLCSLSLTFIGFSFIADETTSKSPGPRVTRKHKSKPYKRTSPWTLRLVHVIHRHGDRSQLKSYKRDIYTEQDWPLGFGQLTQLGMRQTKNLGVFLRQRYIDTGFLDRKWRPREVYSRSTDISRTLMSAYCVLAGMFPLDETQTWDPSLAWMPIPVHTVDHKTDPLLNRPCPAYERAINRTHQQNPFIEEVMTKYKDEIHYISRHSGEPETWDRMIAVQDAIYCQHANGFKMPSWVDRWSLQTLLEIRDLNAKAERIDQEDFAYLKHGPFLREIIGHMLLSVNAELTYKFFQYSAHDTNILGFLTMLGLFNDRQPPYTACIMIELHEPASDHFVVKILYRNETEHEPYPLQLEGCSIECPLEKFIDLTRRLIPADPDLECGVPATDKSEELFIHTDAVIMFVVWILTVLSTVVLCLRNRYKRNDKYSYIMKRREQFV